MDNDNISQNGAALGAAAQPQTMIPRVVDRRAWHGLAKFLLLAGLIWAGIVLIVADTPVEIISQIVLIICLWAIYKFKRWGFYVLIGADSVMIVVMATLLWLLSYMDSYERGTYSPDFIKTILYCIKDIVILSLIVHPRWNEMDPVFSRRVNRNSEVMAGPHVVASSTVSSSKPLEYQEEKDMSDRLPTISETGAARLSVDVLTQTIEARWQSLREDLDAIETLVPDHPLQIPAEEQARRDILIAAVSTALEALPNLFPNDQAARLRECSISCCELIFGPEYPVRKDIMEYHRRFDVSLRFPTRFGPDQTSYLCEKWGIKTLAIEGGPGETLYMSAHPLAEISLRLLLTNCNLGIWKQIKDDYRILPSY